MLKPRQGRKIFNLEILSPLTGLLKFIHTLIPRLAPWAINLPPLTGLKIRHCLNGTFARRSVYFLLRVAGAAVSLLAK